MMMMMKFSLSFNDAGGCAALPGLFFFAVWTNDVLALNSFLGIFSRVLSHFVLVQAVSAAKLQPTMLTLIIPWSVRNRHWISGGRIGCIFLVTRSRFSGWWRRRSVTGRRDLSRVGIRAIDQNRWLWQECSVEPIFKKAVPQASWCWLGRTAS